MRIESFFFWKQIRVHLEILLDEFIEFLFSFLCSRVERMSNLILLIVAIKHLLRLKISSIIPRIVNRLLIVEESSSVTISEAKELC